MIHKDAVVAGFVGGAMVAWAMGMGWRSMAALIERAATLTADWRDHTRARKILA